jgi:hypothetical protein
MIIRDPNGEVRFIQVEHVAVAEPGHVGGLQHNSNASVEASDESSTTSSRRRTEKELLIMVPGDKALRAIHLRCKELV